MKRSTLLMAVAVIAVTGVYAQTKKVETAATTAKTKPVTAAVNPFKNNKDSASYSLGFRIAQNLKQQGFENMNIALMEKGMVTAFDSKKSIITDSLLDPSINKFQQKVLSAKSGNTKAEGKLFLANNAKRKGVVVLKDGLQYEIMKAGSDTAAKPTLTSKVKCHYHGTLVNGKVFDSSVDRGEPISFELGGVIRGWQEALQLMTVGSKWKLFIPSDLAYGDQGSGPIPGNSVLIFEVELLGIEK
jgi:FKBP-type peptidyl-prolyl cis-trans isomerase FklB